MKSFRASFRIRDFKRVSQFLFPPKNSPLYLYTLRNIILIKYGHFCKKLRNDRVVLGNLIRLTRTILKKKKSNNIIGP